VIANSITLSRLPLLVLIIVLLYQPLGNWRIVAAPLILLLIALDSVDGIVARRLGQTSILGSVLDIAADRTVEFLLWVVFADLGLIPIVIPLVVLTRGVFVDAIRAVAPARGLKPFDLMRSRLGRFLVKSPWLRTPFALAKAVAFFLLALAHGLQTVGQASATTMLLFAQGTAWGALALCLLRGVPVLIEGPRALTDTSK